MSSVVAQALGSDSDTPGQLFELAVEVRSKTHRRSDVRLYLQPTRCQVCRSRFVHVRRVVADALELLRIVTVPVEQAFEWRVRFAGGHQIVDLGRFDSKARQQVPARYVCVVGGGAVVATILAGSVGGLIRLHLRWWL